VAAGNKYHAVQDSMQADTIVMLTGGEEGNILRIREVLRLYYERRYDDVKIIVSGNDPLTATDNEETSATKVERILCASGVNPEDIMLEDMARTTFESARQVEKLIRQEPFFLVTSGYHMPRSIMVFHAFNMNPIPAPTDFKINSRYSLFSFFPGPNNLEKVDLAFHEYFGIVYYRLKLLMASK
jgi:uncharacterized SAM-binding protein YcdF (DUF218 family)